MGIGFTHAELIDEDTFGTIDEAEFFDFCGERRFFVFGAGEAFVRCRQEQQRLEDNFLGEGFRQGKNPVRERRRLTSAKCAARTKTRTPQRSEKSKYFEPSRTRPL